VCVCVCVCVHLFWLLVSAILVDKLSSDGRSHSRVANILITSSTGCTTVLHTSVTPTPAVQAHTAYIFCVTNTTLTAAPPRRGAALPKRCRTCAP
jgi:hypothetical protein